MFKLTGNHPNVSHGVVTEKLQNEL